MVTQSKSTLYRFNKKESLTIIIAIENYRGGVYGPRDKNQSVTEKIVVIFNMHVYV